MSTPRETLACVVSPNAADAELAVTFLGQTGVQARAFASLRELAWALDEGIGCLILVEEALLAEDIPALREALARLPAWCDLPLILVSRDVGALGAAAADAFPDAGNVTLLERPINAHTLISAVQMALRASARQREVGELLAQREQAVRLRDEFLAMLAHELRNPLAPMSNALHIMRMLKIEDPAAVKSIQILERQVGHVVRMVDDLMDVARLERGKVVLKKERLDLNRVVSSAVETCLHAAQERGHNVSVRFGTNALPVDGDAVRLEQIVCNLLNNAAKFTPRPSEILVQTSVEAGFARVAVEDKGIGFQAEAAEHLFDPFLQDAVHARAPVARHRDLVAPQVEKHAQRFADIGVVLDDHDAAAAALEGWLRGLPLRFGHSGSERNPNDETRSLAGSFARGVDRPAVQLGEAPHDGQPHAQAPRAALERRIDLQERIEEVLRSFRLEADALVLDRDQRESRLHGGLDEDLARPGGELGRIVHQVAHDLLQPHRVAVHR